MLNSVEDTATSQGQPQSNGPGGAESLLIILATFNERGNLPSLLDRLNELLPQANVLVVDDGSPDGTAEWCRDRCRADRRLHLLERPGQRGLGTATRLGLQWGLTRGFTWLATMDADWSHDPADAARLFSAAVESPSDHLGVWIGSRYVEGGAVVGWSAARHVASRLINRMGSKRLRLPVRDISSALRVYRAASLRALNWGRLRDPGYGYLEELLVALDAAKIGMQEVPITFGGRRQGRSKMRWRDVWGVLRQTLFSRDR